MNDKLKSAYEWLINCFEGPLKRRKNIIICEMSLDGFKDRFKIDLPKETKEGDFVYIFIDTKMRSITKMEVGKKMFNVWKYVGSV